MYTQFLTLRFQKKISSYNPKFPSWFTKSLINNVTTKNKLLKKLNNSRSEHKYSFLNNKIKTLKQVIRRESRRAYTNYTKLCENQLKTNPRKIWNLNRKKMKNSNGMPNMFDFNGRQYSSASEIASTFAYFFSSMHVTQNNNEFDLLDDNVKVFKY